MPMLTSVKHEHNIREDETFGLVQLAGTNKRVKTMELIKTWRKNGFTLRLWDTYKTDNRGQTRLAYELKHGRKVIFKGDDFCGSPLHSDDSRETIGGLLGFLSLKPGDTDSEYFANYTAEQLEFVDAFGDELSILAMDLRGE